MGCFSGLEMNASPSAIGWRFFPLLNTMKHKVYPLLARLAEHKKVFNPHFLRIFTGQMVFGISFNFYYFL